jgi:hypothetical protein
LLLRQTGSKGQTDTIKQQTDVAPITFGKLKTKLGKIKDNRLQTVKVLFDTGASETIVSNKYTKDLRQKVEAPQVWKTAAGTVKSIGKAIIYFSLPEFYESTVIQHEAHVFSTDISYDLIIGRDLMRLLGIKIDLETDQVKWADASIPMKSPGCTTSTGANIYGWQW